MPLPSWFWGSPSPSIPTFTGTPPNKKPKLGWRPDFITFPTDEAKRVTIYTMNQKQPMMVQRTGHGGRQEVGLICAAFPFEKDKNELEVNDFQIGVWWMTPRRYQLLQDINNEWSLGTHDVRITKKVDNRHLPTLEMAPCRESFYDEYKKGRSIFGSVLAKLEELGQAIQEGKEVDL